MDSRSPREVAFVTFTWDFLWSKQDDAVAQVAQVASDLTQEAGTVDLVERALQVHCQKASSFVIAVSLKPSLNGVDDGLTAVSGSRTP